MLHCGMPLDYFGPGVTLCHATRNNGWLVSISFRKAFRILSFRNGTKDPALLSRVVSDTKVMRTKILAATGLCALLLGGCAYPDYYAGYYDGPRYYGAPPGYYGFYGDGYYGDPYDGFYDGFYGDDFYGLYGGGFYGGGFYGGGYRGFHGGHGHYGFGHGHGGFGHGGFGHGGFGHGGFHGGHR